MEDCPLSIPLSDIGNNAYGAYKSLDIFLENQYDQKREDKRNCYNFLFSTMKSEYNGTSLHDGIFQLGNLSDNEQVNEVDNFLKDLNFQNGKFINQSAFINEDYVKSDFILNNNINQSRYEFFNRSNIPTVSQTHFIQNNFESINPLNRINQTCIHSRSFEPSNGTYNFLQDQPILSNEKAAQTDGFMIPLDGPFYIGSHDCIISDEKLIDACFHFMHLRSEFLSMLGYSSLNDEDENYQADNVVQQKRKKKLINKNSTDFTNTLTSKSQKLSSIDFRFQPSQYNNHNDNFNETNMYQQFTTEYLDEESRASGVPIMRPIKNEQDYPYSLSPNDRSIKRITGSKLNSSSESLGETNSIYMKRRSSVSESSSQVDNGATPGRPRMNRSDFACTLCQTRNTPQWRYLELEPVCNACYMRARKLQRASNTSYPQSTHIRNKLARYNRFNKDKISKANNISDNSKSESVTNSSNIQLTDETFHKLENVSKNYENPTDSFQNQNPFLFKMEIIQNNTSPNQSDNKFSKSLSPICTTSSPSEIMVNINQKESLNEFSNSIYENNNRNINSDKILSNEMEKVGKKFVKQEPGNLNWSDEEEK